MTIQNITFAGHSAFFLTASSSDNRDIHIAIDPWLEGNPLCPEDLKNPEKLDLIILTHGHSDHAGDTLRIAKKTGAKIAATYELAMLFGKERIPQEQLIPMNKGGSVEFNNLEITLTHAHHSSSYDNESGTHYAGEACGCVIGDGEKNIYHAGDTALFIDMKLIEEQYAPSIALLPIGDHFTMGEIEAAKAAKFIGAPINIPMHYKTFELLNQDAERFKSECAKNKQEVVELAPGDSINLTK